MRLIDADALKLKLKYGIHTDRQCTLMGFVEMASMSKILEKVDEQPTIQQERTAKCKDCEFCGRDLPGMCPVGRYDEPPKAERSCIEMLEAEIGEPMVTYREVRQKWDLLTQDFGINGIGKFVTWLKEQEEQQ